jgi:GlpG protein
MRMIGHLADEPSARLFGDFLYAQGIESQAEREPDKGWAIWIPDEDQLAKAGGFLSEFRQNPQDPKYRVAGNEAEKLRTEAEAGKDAYRKRLRNRRHLFRPMTPYGFGPLTFALIVISAAVFLRSHYGEDNQPIMDLFITDYTQGSANHLLPEIRSGQVWRLITPIFIHFGILHILFNMLWLRDLGSMIEGRQSSLHLLALVLVIAVCSNTAQYLVEHTPVFGGMSGVVYGLLGYVWIRGKFDPGSGLYLHPSTVVMMLIWFVACLTGMVGLIANTAHAVGLGMGILWGWLSSLRYR